MTPRIMSPSPFESSLRENRKLWTNETLYASLVERPSGGTALQSSILPLLDLPAVQRAKVLHSSFWFTLPVHISLFDEFVFFTEEFSTRRGGALLLGETNVGKTEFIHELHRPYAEMTSRSLIVEVPPDPKIRDILASVREILHERTGGSSDKPVSRSRLKEELHSEGIWYLFLDEAHRLTFRARRDADLFLFIKDFLDYFDLNVVLIGMPEIRDPFLVYGQVSRRFLSYFDYPVISLDTYFLDFLSILESFLPLKESSDLHSSSLSSFIYRESNGSLGRARDLVESAVRFCLKLGQERITLSLLEQCSVFA